MKNLFVFSVFAVMMLVAPQLSYAAPTSADDLMVQRGAYLAKVGDCMACHSAVQGKPYSGGFSMATPMGTVYSTNITPDQSTGIGSWSEQDFARALRRGISKDGHNLYPAMPYPSYAKVNDDDVTALYAYFMRGVTPVHQMNRASDIPFPLNARWPLKIWNWIFLDSAGYESKDQQNAEWNRGAYLVQGLGHCGACHTPRGVAFQEKASDERGAPWLSGALVDGWFASNLTQNKTAGIGGWSDDDLIMFLKTGANSHAIAFGSMTEVINNSTQYMDDVDLHSIVRYLKSLPSQSDSSSATSSPNDKGAKGLGPEGAASLGSKVYAVYCMNCHGVTGAGISPFLSPLVANPNILEHDPSSLINVTLNGSHELSIGGVPAAYPMPSFSKVLDDEEIADVLTYVRGTWQNSGAPVTSKQVERIRSAR